MVTNGWASHPDSLQHNFYYRNDGGILTRSLESVAASDAGWSYGAGWGDHDDDGDLDAIVTR